MDSIGTCVECGADVGEDESPGVLLHLTEDGGIDYDKDRDHVAILDVDYGL